MISAQHLLLAGLRTWLAITAAFTVPLFAGFQLVQRASADPLFSALLAPAVVFAQVALLQNAAGNWRALRAVASARKEART